MSNVRVDGDEDPAAINPSYQGIKNKRRENNHQRGPLHCWDTPAVIMDSVSSALSTAASQLHHPHSPFDPYRDPFDLSGPTGGQQHHRKNSAVEEPPESWSSGGNSSVHSPLEPSVNQNHSVNGTAGAMDITMQSTDGSAAHDSKKKRFVCPHCTRTFARSGHLQRHERSRRPPLILILVIKQIRMKDRSSALNVLPHLVV